MREFLLSWRGVLWSLVCVAVAADKYRPSNEVIDMADKVLAGFDDRFEILSNGVIKDKRK